MKKAVTNIPVTVKLRLGWNDEMRNVIEQAQAAVDGGADALFVHGRTRNARYRFAADWDAIGSVVAARAGASRRQRRHPVSAGRGRARARDRDARA